VTICQPLPFRSISSDRRRVRRCVWSSIFSLALLASCHMGMLQAQSSVQASPKAQSQVKPDSSLGDPVETIKAETRLVNLYATVDLLFLARK